MGNRAQHQGTRTRSPREYTCERCGIVFLHKGQGRPRYCFDCKGIVCDEIQARNQVMQRAKQVAKRLELNHIVDTKAKM